jgi:predicted porin
MKKTLVALAAVSAVSAFAQSAFSIDGLVDAGYQVRDYKGNSVSGFNNNGSATSQINLRFTEDLGAGLKANFRMENDINPVSNGINQGAATYTNSPSQTTALSTWGNGELRIGVSSTSWGSVDVGAVNFASLDAIVVGSPYGTAIGGAYSKVIKADYNGVAVRADNSARYMTPSFNGLSFSILASKKQNVSLVTSGVSTTMSPATNALGYNNQTGVGELAAKYSNGPINAVVSVLTFDRGGIGTNGTGSSTATSAYNDTKIKLNTGAVNYTVGAWKAGLIIQTNKGQNATNFVDQSAAALSLVYTTGPLALSIQQGSINNRQAIASTTTNAATLVATTKSFGMGADYALSKNTSLYGRYEKVNDDANLIGGYYSGTTVSIFATPSSGTTRSLTAFGIRAAF